MTNSMTRSILLGSSVGQCLMSMVAFVVADVHVAMYCMSMAILTALWRQSL